LTTTSQVGDCENLDLVRDVMVVPQAISTTLSPGLLVYQDAANGMKVVPTTVVEGNAARFPINIPPAGQTSNATLGNKVVESVKTGAIVIGVSDGIIGFDKYVQVSGTVAGRFQLEALVITTVTTLRDTLLRRVGRCLGKASGGLGLTVGSIPIATADGDPVRVIML